MKYILPAMIVASIMWIIWMIKYPSELWEALVFRKQSGYIFFGLMIWIYLFGFVGTMVYLTRVIL